MGMFLDSEFNGDISKWNVGKVKDMDRMFRRSKFNKDISKWNVSSVTNMRYMFDRSTFNQDLSSWMVTNVTECIGFSRDNFIWTKPKPDFTNCDPN